MRQLQTWEIVYDRILNEKRKNLSFNMKCVLWRKSDRQRKSIQTKWGLSHGGKITGDS